MAITRRNSETWLPDIFNDFFDTNWMARTNATAPAINVLEHDDKYELELAAPGLTKDDFKKHGHYLRREFSYSQYQQIMTLPEDADREHIEAKVENGVLTVNIPKIVKKPQEAHKLIEVK